MYSPLVKNSKYLSSLIPAYAHTYIDFDVIVDEPFRAVLLHSPGRKPWVNYWNTFIEPQRGEALIGRKKYGLFGNETKSVSYQLDILLLHLLREETLADAGFPLR